MVDGLGDSCIVDGLGDCCIVDGDCITALVRAATSCSGNTIVRLRGGAR